MEESEYRQKIEAALNRIEKALRDVDPDLAECENTMGSLTILFSDRTRCILSAQPSLQQLWLALAAEGTAYHFNFDPGSANWRDDKGGKVELISFLETYLSRKTGLALKL